MDTAGKRFARIGVDVFGLIYYSGKDLQKVVDFFERWLADADMPAGQLFGGYVKELEPTRTKYDPDDAAP